MVTIQDKTAYFCETNSIQIEDAPCYQDESGIVHPPEQYADQILSLDDSTVSAWDLTRRQNEARAKRQAEYIKRSDGIFWDYQRGEKTYDEWIIAVNIIKSEIPIPTE